MTESATELLAGRCSCLEQFAWARHLRIFLLSRVKTYIFFTTCPGFMLYLSHFYFQFSLCFIVLAITVTYLLTYTAVMRNQRKI